MTPKDLAEDATAPAELSRSHAPTVVMIGAGQLARITHQAAVDFGVTLHVLAEHADDPAVLGGAPYTIGSPDSLEDIVAVAAIGDVVTLDHELVATEALATLVARGVAVHPGPDALLLAKDKLAARERLGALDGVPVPAFAAVHSASDVEAFAARHGWPVVVKARRGGYDGRGVHIVTSSTEARALVGEVIADDPAFLVEEKLDLASEFAIVLARRPSGELASYPPVATLQLDGICNELTMPAALAADIVTYATGLAERIATAIGATGICAVEFFLTTSGRVVLNELALRPHNSGHATIEACTTSQFHQHVRAVLDWPLGPTTLRSAAATVNVIGGNDGIDPADRLPDALRIPGIHVHLYQKATRPGRKLGHVTALAENVDDALAAARAAAAALSGR